MILLPLRLFLVMMILGKVCRHICLADYFDTGLDTEVQNGSDNTLSGVSYFDRDDEIYVIVTPNDGVDDGSP